MKEYNLRLIEVRRRPAKARRIFVSLRAICRLMVFCLLAASVSHAVVKAAVAESTAATDYIDSAEQITFDDDRDFIGREASSQNFISYSIPDMAASVRSRAGLR